MYICIYIHGLFQEVKCTSFPYYAAVCCICPVYCIGADAGHLATINSHRLLTSYELLLTFIIIEELKACCISLYHHCLLYISPIIIVST